MPNIQHVLLAVLCHKHSCTPFPEYLVTIMLISHPLTLRTPCLLPPASTPLLMHLKAHAPGESSMCAQPDAL